MEQDQESRISRIEEQVRTLHDKIDKICIQSNAIPDHKSRVKPQPQNEKVSSVCCDVQVDDDLEEFIFLFCLYVACGLILIGCLAKCFMRACHARHHANHPQIKHQHHHHHHHHHYPALWGALLFD